MQPGASVAWVQRATTSDSKGDIVSVCFVSDAEYSLVKRDFLRYVFTSFEDIFQRTSIQHMLCND